MISDYPLRTMVISDCLFGKQQWSVTGHWEAVVFRAWVLGTTVIVHWETTVTSDPSLGNNGDHLENNRDWSFVNNGD